MRKKKGIHGPDLWHGRLTCGLCINILRHDAVQNWISLIQLLANERGKAAENGRELGPLPAMWETSVRFLAHRSGLVQPQCSSHLGSDPVYGRLFSLLSLSLLSNFQIHFQKSFKK